MCFLNNGFKMRKDIAHYSEKLVKDLVEVELVDVSIYRMIIV